MSISYKNLEQTIKTLAEYFKCENLENIASVEYPDNIKYKSAEWLYYIFYSCLLDYGMRSKIYHQNLINTYSKYAFIFNPKYVMQHYSDASEELHNIIVHNIHPRYPNVATNKWLNLSRSLAQYVNLLEEIKCFKTFEQLNNFIKNIQGYGQKTGGLLIRLIYESGICNFSNDLQAIPLDRHDIEISYLNKIIDNKKLNAKQINELSTEYIKCGQKMKLKPDAIDKYLWEIGNRFCNKSNCLNCPLNKNCKGKHYEKARI